MMIEIAGWRFDTEKVRSVRYRYSLGRLILEFKRRTVEIEMSQALGELYVKRVVLAWRAARDC